MHIILSALTHVCIYVRYATKKIAHHETYAYFRPILLRTGRLPKPDKKKLFSEKSEYFQSFPKTNEMLDFGTLSM